MKRFAPVSRRLAIFAPRDFRPSRCPASLGDFLNKMMLASYNGAATTYQYLTSTKPLTDFKPLHLFRLVGTGEFHEIGPAGELKHIGAVEQTYSVEAATLSALILLTRQSVINDDLGAFAQFAQILGRRAR